MVFDNNNNNDELKDYLKKQIEELEVDVNKKCFEYKINIKKVSNMDKDLNKLKEEYDLYINFYPYYKDIKEISEEQLNLKINTFDFIDETKEKIKELEDQIFILNKTIGLQKDNIDLMVKKIVDLKVNLNWVSGD